MIVNLNLCEACSCIRTYTALYGFLDIDSLLVPSTVMCMCARARRAAPDAASGGLSRDP